MQQRHGDDLRLGNRPALAQTQEAGATASNALDPAIMVAGSRVMRNGNAAPQPITVARVFDLLRDTASRHCRRPQQPADFHRAARSAKLDQWQGRFGRLWCRCRVGVMKFVTDKTFKRAKLNLRTGLSSATTIRDTRLITGHSARNRTMPMAT